MKKYTPAGLTLSIRIAVSAEKDFWVVYISSQTSESGYSKIRKISVSAMDGVLVGRQERIHSGVLIWGICGLVCATSKELLAVVV